MAPAAPFREPFAAGDYLIRSSTESGQRLTIDSPVEKPGWKARTPEGLHRSSHPGTAVRFEEELWEVVSHQLSDSSPQRHFYDLAPWPDHAAYVGISEYSKEWCEKQKKLRIQRARDLRRGELLDFFGVFLGLLPGADQKRLENQYNTPAIRNTLLSAVPVFVLAVIGQWARAYGEATPLDFFPLAYPLLGAESALRLYSVLRVGEPMGVFLVSFPILCWRSLKRARSPERQRQSHRRRAIHGEFERFATAVDQVDSIENDRLRITSVLPKNHWTLTKSGVRFQDRIWIPVEREVLGTGKETRYRFFLEPLEEGGFIAEMHDYSPQEVQQLHRLELKKDHQTWVETFAPLWGFVEPRIQDQLERVYGYEPSRWIRSSCFLGGGLGLLLAFVAWSESMRPERGLFDMLAFLAGLFFAIEATLRWRALARGRPTGSVLGKLFEPWSKRFTKIDD